MRRLHPAWFVLGLGAVLGGCQPQAAERMRQAHGNDAPVASPLAQQPVDAEVEATEVALATEEGVPFRGYLAQPGSGRPSGGVLVFHEWWGLNDNIRAMTRQLAAEGYAALALDVYGGATAQEPQRAQQLMQQALAQPDLLKAKMRAGVQHLQKMGAARIGTLGWCFGGTLSFEATMALPEQVHAAVVYYGFVRADETELQRVGAPILGLFGGADAAIPASRVQAFERNLRRLGKPVEVVMYQGAGHAFANPSGRHYEPVAAADAWRRTRAFFAAHLGGK